MTAPLIAHLLPNYNPFPPVYPAGTELRVEQVSLRQSRYRSLVVCGGFAGERVAEQIGSMRIRRIRFSPLYRRLFQKITRLDPLPYAYRMWKIVREEGVSVLHIHNEPKLLVGLAPYLRKNPLPVVVHIANHKPIPTDAIPLVTRWVACSHFMADWLRDSCKVPADRIEVIYTGTDVSGRAPYWQLPPAERRQLRQRFEVDDDNALVFVFGGRLVKEKGVAEMLDAFALVRERLGQPVRLLIAGNVRESTDSRNEKARYGQAMVERISSAADVNWVGSLKPSDMHNFLLAGDVFLLPSLWDDPFPTVMLEAAAAGLPIVAGARGGITEFLKDCPGQRFIDPAKPEEMAEAMLELANSPALRTAAGSWLRGIIETRFDWQRVTADFEAMYDRILTRQSISGTPSTS
jgi:glycosyltransferase involved in cell wall biosynthesis